MSCSVCWKENKNNIKTPCNHVFCFDCLYKWVIINPNCPCCRRNFTEEEILEYYKNYSNEIITRSKTKKLRRSILMKKSLNILKKINLSTLLTEKKELVIELVKLVIENKNLLKENWNKQLLLILYKKLLETYFNYGLKEFFYYIFKLRRIIKSIDNNFDMKIHKDHNVFLLPNRLNLRYY